MLSRKAVDSKLRSYPWNYKKQLLIHAHQKRFYKIIIKARRLAHTRARPRSNVVGFCYQKMEIQLYFTDQLMISRELRRKALNYLWKSFLGM
jgi:hypothetical protein